MHIVPQAVNLTAAGLLIIGPKTIGQTKPMCSLRLNLRPLGIVIYFICKVLREIFNNSHL